MSTVVGRVAALHRYPVKSMAGEPLDRAEVAWHGLAEDRRWGFLREGRAGSGFPWLTLRQRPELVRYRPRLTDRSVVVRTPSGVDYDVADPALAAELGGWPLKLDGGAFDSAPVSVLTAQSVAAVGAADERRFRPNVLVDAEGEFPEDAWVGGSLSIGEAVLRVDREDRRCGVVSVDPDTGRRDPTVLRTIAEQHGMTLGVYGSVVVPGRIAVGDPVVLAPDRTRAFA
ncbi:MOSC N-terminal beta barrel domain-containing protein [Actinosynnema sp. NPDC023587]|uniref:MOSC domain-containing protein n=1 Tax=Actinosynnema sp. NPDC023587 TaxID=3154695 RepID=UPI0033C3CD34